jgi:hypothetical protein
MRKQIIPFLLGAALIFAVAAGVSRQPFYAAGPTLVQTGTCIATDGTVTNTFTIAYSSAPKVFCTQTGTGLNSATNLVTSITTTNFQLKTSLANTTNSWIAVGTP